MKIGIEVQRIFRPAKHGMEIVAMELIRQIQQQDTVNQYILFAKNDRDNDCIRETSHFKIYTIPSLTYADWEQVSLPLAIKKQKPDFLHCTCNTAPLYCPVPLVLTLHDIIYLENMDFKGSSYQNIGNLYRRLIIPKLVKNTDRIITVSHFEKNLIIEKLKVPENKINVIYHAASERFNTHYTEIEKSAFRQEFNLPAQFILFLGNTSPKKNTHNVIRGFLEYCQNNSDGLPLVITDYEEKYVLKISHEFGRPDLMKKLIMPGYITTDQMPLMYNCASLFLYPSLRESFGLPLLEAMACGTAVITSNTSSMPEIAGNAACFVNPLNYQEIAAAIYRLLSDDGLRKDYQNKGLIRAKVFTWEKAAGELLQVYEAMGQGL